MQRALYSLTGFKLAFVTAHLTPRAWCQWLATRVGLAAYRRSPCVQEALRANLGLVTGKTGPALDDLCATNVANFSRMLSDYFLCSGMDAARQAHRIVDEWSGFEHLKAARAAGRGAIIVTAHLGHWELGGVTLARRGLPLTVVTLEEPSTELTRWREACRRHLGIRTIAVGPGYPFAFVEMIQALRRNELLAMLVDRPYPGSGAAVEFFGRQTEFSTAPALLSHHTGAAVLPAFVLQKPNGLYASIAAPLIPMASRNNGRTALAENTQRIATNFESIIRQHPDQWFNYVPIWRGDGGGDSRDFVPQSPDPRRNGDNVTG
jgi:KDO2-lipid IV(A) lauroyltransferase